MKYIERGEGFSLEPTRIIPESFTP